MVINVKKIIKYLSIIITLLFMFTINCSAENNNVYVNLEKLEYSLDKNNFSIIKKYKTLKEFLDDYNSNTLPDIYITEFLFDGVSAVKVPSLDDFKEDDSNTVEIKELKIKVININTIGNIEFTGEIKGAMIGVNTNNKTGNINIVLNNVKIDTDTKKAPAIYVYNKDKNYTDCKVTIKTLINTKNYIKGGKLKKVSLIPSDKLDKYASYYSNNSLANYNKYSSYYGIYSSSEIDKILFAKVLADSEDLSEGDPYYFYKGSGAISSDIDLYFDGEGYLQVIGNDEGIETKGNLMFSGGYGDYEIIAFDDCLNTTTVNSNYESVRNDLVIDVHSLLAYVSADADEGDAIDSNGKLVINGGNIYAFAHPTSPDAGLDSVNGIYLNKGTIISTGNMQDTISSDSKQKFLYANFNEISADTLIIIKNQDNEVIMAFKTERNIRNLLYSSSDLNYETYSIFTGGTIDGEETNGLYTKINDYTNGNEIKYNNTNMGMKFHDYNNDYSSKLLKALIIEIILLFTFIIIYVIRKDKSRGEI